MQRLQENNFEDVYQQSSTSNMESSCWFISSVFLLFLLQSQRPNLFILFNHLINFTHDFQHRFHAIAILVQYIENRVWNSNKRIWPIWVDQLLRRCNNVFIILICYQASFNLPICKSFHFLLSHNFFSFFLSFPYFHVLFVLTFSFLVSSFLLSRMRASSKSVSW